MLPAQCFIIPESVIVYFLKKKYSAESLYNSSNQELTLLLYSYPIFRSHSSFTNYPNIGFYRKRFSSEHVLHLVMLSLQVSFNLE